jgi:TRAP-type C4-dicarboxylate transport system permease small subunit
MRQRFDTLIGHFLTILMVAMLISVVWQVFTRYIVQVPSAFTDELARYLLIWIGTLGAAFIAGKNMHLAIDLLPGHLEGRAKYRLLVIINLLIISFALLVMVIGGIRLVYITYTLGQTSAALQIPLSFIYSIMPLSGMLIIFYKIYDIIYLQEAPDPGAKIVE